MRYYIQASDGERVGWYLTRSVAEKDAARLHENEPAKGWHVIEEKSWVDDLLEAPVEETTNDE